MATPTLADVLRATERAVRNDGRAALCQIVRVEGSTPGKPGWKLLLTSGGDVVGNLGGGAFEALVKADAAQKLRDAAPLSELKRYYFTEKAVRGEATGMVCGGMAEVFLEILEAPAVLLVCGGGPVGQALVQAGELAGFEVAVAEDRPEFRRQELFSEATRLVTVNRDYDGDFLAELSGRPLFVAIVTRCWETDAAALRGIARQAPPTLRYVGLMGSHRKVERVRADLQAAGLDLAGHVLHAPIGLPIGGDQPGEIAISILGEIIQVRRGGRREHSSTAPGAVAAAADRWRAS